MQRRRFVRRSAGKGPSRTWMDLSATFGFAAVTVSSTASLLQLQTPSPGTITSDPPQDLTVLRVVGSFSMTMAGAVGGNWTLGLTVQDVTWTPSTLFRDDADKRILWRKTYSATNATQDAWLPPDTHLSNTTPLQADRESVSLDISPKVRVEPGQSLYLVAWENANGANVTVASSDMRVLFQRSGRR